MARELKPLTSEGTVPDGFYIYTDGRDPKSGGTSHHYRVMRVLDNGDEVCFCKIDFQHGPRKEGGIAGIWDAHLMEILIDRMEGYLEGPFAHESAQVALDHLKVALQALDERAQERLGRGVLGKNAI